MSESIAKVGIVTVTYNSANVIAGFMQSVLKQTHSNFTLFVIDNSSTDATLAQLSQYKDPRISIVRNEANVGVAEGNNQGILSALESGCRHVLLLNNDTEFGDHLLQALLTFSNRVRADMVVPKITFFQPNNLIWCAGGYFKRWKGYVTGHFGENELDSPKFSAPREVEYAPTCCMLINEVVFHTIGKMDERYFVYGDDTDFCWRALKQGFELWYTPTAILFHKVSSLTGGYKSDFTIRFATRNKVYFALKHLSLVLQIYCLSLYLATFLTKFLLQLDSIRVFKIKLAAFCEGVRLNAQRKAAESLDNKSQSQ